MTIEYDKEKLVVQLEQVIKAIEEYAKHGLSFETEQMIALLGAYCADAITKLAPKKEVAA